MADESPADEPDMLPPQAFARIDEGDDLAFYSFPRLVHHIDEVAVAALSATYKQLIPENAAILDLMSSWVSHLPKDVEYAEVIGHGMNAEELAANPQLSGWFTQDLNRDPALPLQAASLDAATICVGVQYLQQPILVLQDIRRAVKPGAPLVVSFSNRCFPTKATAIWLRTGDRDHAALVELYLRTAGFGEVETHALADGRSCDPLIAVTGRA